MNLNTFLESRGIFIEPNRCAQNDGYISEAQKKQFSKQLLLYPHLRTIAEIGFNAGHSAEHFFNECKELQVLVSFDVNAYPSTKHAVEYFYSTYPNRFLFIQGDSLVKVPEIHRRFPRVKFDLIYIDGCHDFEWALADIANAKKIAHERTILWIDDVEPDLQGSVGAAVKFHETVGLIQIEQFFTSEDPVSGRRSWLQANYSTLPSTQSG